METKQLQLQDEQVHLLLTCLDTQKNIIEQDDEIGPQEERELTYDVDELRKSVMRQTGIRTRNLFARR
jgi:hypothetical protein